jgi:hypothetical protein
MKSRYNYCLINTLFPHPQTMQGTMKEIKERYKALCGMTRESHAKEVINDLHTLSNYWQIQA